MNPRTKTVTKVIGLFIFLALCLLVGVIGGFITSSSVETWYQTLNKPSFNPPDWLFAPVWSSLYIMMAIAAWRVWLRIGLADGWLVFVLFFLQLILNLAWSYLFFGLHRIDLALLEIIILLTLIIINAVVFWRIDRLAGMLFMPYIVWVFYANILNFSLLMMNPT
ncbi:MAG: TspO/MBR family protein [Gammaproteobacteria bacterium]|nr:TspO/MBR family protein [Gammaproteobacteria bacterium]